MANYDKYIPSGLTLDDTYMLFSKTNRPSHNP